MTTSPAAVRGWAVAVSVYLLAVFHRTSLGVAGVAATDRFEISPAQLSAFVLVQLGVYAAMQIPTGVLVDRYGPRRLLVAAATTMGLAQLLFAVVPSYPAALFARALLGAGDALTFISVLRFAAARFDRRHYPLVVAVTALVGTTGNIVATVPLAALLEGAGWTPGFAAAGLLSLVTGAAVFALLPAHDEPAAARLSRAALPRQIAAVRGRIAEAWAHPATRAGFWVHFSTMSSGAMFGVLWGFPYLVQGLGLSGAQAGSVLMVGVLVAAVSGPVLGWLTGRYPVVRVPTALVVWLGVLIGWAVVLGVFGGHPPVPVIVAHVAFMGLGGPASMVGFALARDYNRPLVMGTASGIVNVGGFLAAVAMSVGVGVVLDLAGSTEFALAFLVVVAVHLAGGALAVRWWLRTRSYVLSRQSLGETVPVTVVRHRWDLAVRPAGVASGTMSG